MSCQYHHHCCHVNPNHNPNNNLPHLVLGREVEV